MGRSIAKAALAHGDKVAAVGRTFENTLAAMQDWHPNNYLGLLCDVRVRDTVEAAIYTTISQWGHIDIIANCSGYGVIGAWEDQDEHEIRNQFETNFMGTLNMIQVSLPYFREREQGRYLIFSSTSGALGVPGSAPYCATKYAVEGLIESMLYEVDAYNIKATLVEPGYLRRDDTHPHITNGGRLPAFGHFLVKPPSALYASPQAPAAHAKRMLQWIGPNQPTSVIKAAELVWQLGHCSFPPLRLLLGTFAVESIRDRLRSIMEEIEDWKHLSFPTNDGDASALNADIKEEDDQEHDQGQERAEEDMDES